MFSKFIALFKKKSVASLLASFTALSADLTKLASAKVAEADAIRALNQESYEATMRANDSLWDAYKARDEAYQAQFEGAMQEAEAALHHADKIDSIFKPVAL